jgi:predicted kinase
MAKITLMVGISGSGKSTQAKIMAEKNNAVIVSRDKLREMLFGFTEENVFEYYEVPKEMLYKNEQIITKYQNELILQALKSGSYVIVDNTNLVLKYIKDFFKIFHSYEIDFCLIECELEEAIVRDKKRIRSVGENVIKKQYEDFQKLKNSFDFQPYKPFIPTIDNNPFKKHCVIFDIDGTLALKRNRNAYNWAAVINDSLNIPVERLYNACKQMNYEIIICSGRDAICKEETIKWLEKYNIEYIKLFMREKGDARPDYIVKQEMWAEICKDYYIEFMVDDRNQVVDHARNLGFTVFQVAEGNF